jgi:serine/threonine protein kinase
MDRSGAIIDARYELGDIIGEGGTAVVYEALDLRLGNRVALKMLFVRSPTVALRMQREARVAAALHHPNACLVTDVGLLEDGSPYLVMELLQGISLAQHLRENEPLDVDRTIEIAEQVLSVLSVAHSQGVVHRDIKPENIFLVHVPGRPPFVKVLDFGAATHDAEDGLTVRGNTIGTPAYMSPEQAWGEPDIDGRSDQYSCAAVLFECLTGRRTFDARDSRELLGRISKESPPRIETIRADLPVWVAQAINRSLDVARASRYASALDFLAALGAQGRLTHDAWDVATAALGQVERVDVPGDVPGDECFEDETERFPAELLRGPKRR